MSARSVAEHALTVYFGDSEDPAGMARKVLDNYAHELADKQRDYAEEEWTGGDARMILRRRVAWHLADLIDPEKQS